MGLPVIRGQGRPRDQDSTMSSERKQRAIEVDREVRELVHVVVILSLDRVGVGVPHIGDATPLVCSREN